MATDVVRHAAPRREQIRDEVHDYLVGTFLKSRRSEGLRDDDDLLQVLNSLQLLRMVIELETRYQVAIDNSELSPENLGSIERIAAFIEQKQQTGRAAL